MKEYIFQTQHNTVSNNKATTALICLLSIEPIHTHTHAHAHAHTHTHTQLMRYVKKQYKIVLLIHTELKKINEEYKHHIKRLQDVKNNNL